MKKLIAIIIFTLTQMYGCRENEEIPSKIITIGSAWYDGLKGFSFELNKVTYFSSSEKAKIDFSVFDKVNSNNIIEPFLTNLDSLEIFSLTESFGSKEQADQYFEEYSTARPTIYEPLAPDLEVYQIWTIKTTKGKFAKLMILAIEIGEYEAELKFRWDFVE